MKFYDLAMELLKIKSVILAENEGMEPATSIRLSNYSLILETAVRQGELNDYEYKILRINHKELAIRCEAWRKINRLRAEGTCDPSLVLDNMLDES